MRSIKFSFYVTAAGFLLGSWLCYQGEAVQGKAGGYIVSVIFLVFALFIFIKGLRLPR